MKRIIELVRFDEHQMEYSLIGDGPAILVFHGGHSNCLEEFGYESLINEGFTIITPSRAGYGRTSEAIGKNLKVASEFYRKLLDHLNIEKVHVLGVSAGGPTAIHFASLFPDSTMSLTLQSAVAKQWLTAKDKEYKAARILFNPTIEKITWSLISFLNNRFPRFIFKQMMPSFSTLSYEEVKEKMYLNDIEAIRKMNNRQRSNRGFMIDLAQSSESNPHILNGIVCPVLILHSKNDAAVPIEHPEFAAKHIQKCKVVYLQTWGHLIWLGKEGFQTNRIFIEFLDSINNGELK